MKSKISFVVYSAMLCAFALIVSCSELTNSEKENVDLFHFDTSNVTSYLAVIDSLKPNGYVPFFRFFKQVKFDFKGWNISEEETSFLKDSSAYYKARETFFNQDREFLNWLLSFKNDTILDEEMHTRTLWMPFINPYLSTISPCTVTTPKSRQAINLIYGILNGKEITCMECQIGDLGLHACAVPQYEYVETFLREHGSENLQELREIWKPL